MKVKAVFCALALGLCGGQLAMAHPGHTHQARREIDEEAAKVRAKQEVDRLVSKKKVPESWKEVTVKSVKRKTHKKGWEWVATFENTQVTENKVLYVFLKPGGDFVAANFTGK